MSINKTEKLGLNIWLENEPVNFEEINENFEEIDKMPIPIESGTKSSPYTGGSDSSATWLYKKYSDGSVEMCTRLEFTNLKCNGGTSAPYYSGVSEVTVPFTLSRTYDVQMHLASNTIGWISDITGRAAMDVIRFRVMAMGLETDTEYKQVFINVKGVLA